MRSDAKRSDAESAAPARAAEAPAGHDPPRAVLLRPQHRVPALGYALGDWRLVAGGVAGPGIERARPGARPAALVHAGPAALAARISGLTPAVVAVDNTTYRRRRRARSRARALSEAPRPRRRFNGRLAGGPVDFDEAQIRKGTRRRGGRRRGARAREGDAGSFCYTIDSELSCVPCVYLLGAPKAGTSDLWRLHVPSISVPRGGRKRDFTRGESARRARVI